MRRTLFIIQLLCYGTLSERRYNIIPNPFLQWYGIFEKKEKCPHDLRANIPLRDYYYKELSHFERLPCVVKKSIGGQWPRTSDALESWCEQRGNCETWPQMDGVKTMCMDIIYKPILSGSCLLYSFGLSDDWSFEEILARLGCMVRSFDPTVNGPPIGFDWPTNLSFQRLGISNQTEKVKMLNIPGQNLNYPLDNLENIIDEMKDRGKNISILKLDIEGYEFSVLPQVIDSHIIDFIDQIIVEVHSDKHSERSLEDMQILIQSIDILKSSGFSIVNYDPNFTMGRFPRQYYPNFDITLIKQR